VAAHTSRGIWRLLSRLTKTVLACLGYNLLLLIPRMQSYFCLCPALRLQWYNGLITAREQLSVCCAMRHLCIGVAGTLITLRCRLSANERIAKIGRRCEQEFCVMLLWRTVWCYSLSTFRYRLRLVRLKLYLTETVPGKRLKRCHCRQQSSYWVTYKISSLFCLLWFFLQHYPQIISSKFQEFPRFLVPVIKNCLCPVFIR